MEHVVSKSQFKPRSLEYFREVEVTGQEIIITDRGRPVVKVVPYTPKDIVSELRNSVLKYDDPTEPVGLDDWETLR